MNSFDRKKRLEVRLGNIGIVQSTFVNLASHNKPQLCQAGNIGTLEGIWKN